MRARSIRKRELRGQLLDAASRLLSTAETQAKEGRPHLLRTIVAIATSTSTSEAAKKRLELTESAFEAKVELEQIKLEDRRGESEAVNVELPDWYTKRHETPEKPTET